MEIDEKTLLDESVIKDIMMDDGVSHENDIIKASSSDIPTADVVVASAAAAAVPSAPVLKSEEENTSIRNENSSSNHSDEADTSEVVLSNDVELNKLNNISSSNSNNNGKISKEAALLLKESASIGTRPSKLPSNESAMDEMSNVLLSLKFPERPPSQLSSQSASLFMGYYNAGVKGLKNVLSSVNEKPTMSDLQLVCFCAMYQSLIPEPKNFTPIEWVKFMDKRDPNFRMRVIANLVAVVSILEAADATNKWYSTPGSINLWEKQEVDHKSDLATTKERLLKGDHEDNLKTPWAPAGDNTAATITVLRRFRRNIRRIWYNASNNNSPTNPIAQAAVVLYNIFQKMVEALCTRFHIDINKLVKGEAEESGPSSKKRQASLPTQVKQTTTNTTTTPPPSSSSSSLLLLGEEKSSINFGSKKRKTDAESNSNNNTNNNNNNNAPEPSAVSIETNNNNNNAYVSRYDFDLLVKENATLSNELSKLRADFEVVSSILNSIKRGMNAFKKEMSQQI